MQKALYYPHTQIQSELLLKNALLLWDEIETIIPTKEWRPDPSTGVSRDFSEGVELVVRNRIPSNAERAAAHNVLSQMVDDRVFDKLILQNSKPQRQRFLQRNQEYLIYPEKFMSKTWRVLQEHGLASWERRMSDYAVPPEVGLYMMSILADQCAGTKIRKVTDRVEAYDWLTTTHASLLEAEQLIGFDVNKIAPTHDRLITISMKVLDARDIPLSKLIDMRKREAKSGGSDYSLMRRKYLEALDDHIDQVRTEAKSQVDVDEMERAFMEKIKADIDQLRIELKANAKTTLFSKEVGISALITGGSFAVPFAGFAAVGIGGVIPLVKAASDYRGKRREILQKHIMSWLFTAKRRRFTLF